MVVGSFAIPPRGGLGLAIPGAILAMIGFVLWYQASTGLYATWAYAWALVVPTGVGLGMLLYGLAHRTRRWPARRAAHDPCRHRAVPRLLVLLRGRAGAVRRGVHERAPGGTLRVGRLRRDPPHRGKLHAGSRIAVRVPYRAARRLTGPRRRRPLPARHRNTARSASRCPSRRVSLPAGHLSRQLEGFPASFDPKALPARHHTTRRSPRMNEFDPNAAKPSHSRHVPSLAAMGHARNERFAGPRPESVHSQ